ncbi:MAG: hypothetical protein ACT4P2_15675 [Pseudomonadota bacterium]
MRKRKTPNPKRRLRVVPLSADDPRVLAELAARVRYGGNPEHKCNPGDFDLSPSSQPRPGKTLCDDAKVFRRVLAIELLRTGVCHGLVSVQMRNGWPQNVWAVVENGVPLEAMLENPEMGVYHGYPMLADDPLRDEVLVRWKAR